VYLPQTAELTWPRCRIIWKKRTWFFLTGIRESAVTAAHIVADLLQFSRPQERVASVVNLAQLIDRSIELAKTDYSLKKDYNIQNVTFVRHYSSEPLQVNCLDIEIEQVLINLIQNACQAMTGTPDLTDPQIILCTKQNHDMAVIEVEDNGPGIAEEIRIQIFDPFLPPKMWAKGLVLGSLFPILLSVISMVAPSVSNQLLAKEHDLLLNYLWKKEDV